jgi:hypothetical protein
VNASFINTYLSTASVTAKCILIFLIEPSHCDGDLQMYSIFRYISEVRYV